MAQFAQTASEKTAVDVAAGRKVMQRSPRAKSIVPFVTSIIALAALSPPKATASLPVSFTVVGCVVNGKFLSGKYTFQVDDYRTGQREDADLGHYEGTTLQIDGALSPGDHLVGSYLVLDETCKPELHRSKFN